MRLTAIACGFVFAVFYLLGVIAEGQRGPCVPGDPIPTCEEHVIGALSFFFGGVAAIFGTILAAQVLAVASRAVVRRVRLHRN